MRIVTARRISQIFFFALFIWFCVAATLGERWWQLRGWPVNWLIELDPLAGLGTLLATRTLYAGLIWGLATIGLTLAFGRVFCGFVCPFGAMHQFIGWLGRRGRGTAAQVALNRPHPAQAVKYYILAFMLAASVLLPGGGVSSGSLQTGLLDPLPLAHRSVNLILMPLADRLGWGPSTLPRFYDDAWLIGGVFLAALLLNLKTPRFYCRFVCPLGALLGLLSRWSVWRIGRLAEACTGCSLCEKSCEGACAPTDKIRVSECVMCVNCLDDCRHAAVAYRAKASAGGELSLPADLSRRGLITAAVTGVLAAPVLRVGGLTGPNWNPAVIRPPGSLAEEEFLARCIRCGQCMRVCPTNVIQPAGLEAGIEGLWTPRLNFRIGTSGCQHNCIACGHLCPTAAIRPISLEERMGRGRFAEPGPVRIGMAFVDRGRCLPWANDRPCIVCQENCPVSPKAIVVREAFAEVRLPTAAVVAFAEPGRITLAEDALEGRRLGTGDYFFAVEGGPPVRIAANSARHIDAAADAGGPPPPAGSRISIKIRLQQPYIDPNRCIGCGVCEHECPVLGLRAIRVTAENESRNPHHRMVL
jgi:polyferredoxin